MARTLDKQIRATESEYNLLVFIRAMEMPAEDVKKAVMEYKLRQPEKPAENQPENPAKEKRGTCPRCGSNETEIKENRPGYFAEYCSECSRWIRWVKDPNK